MSVFLSSKISDPQSRKWALRRKTSKFVHPVEHLFPSQKSVCVHQDSQILTKKRVRHLSGLTPFDYLNKSIKTKV